MWITVFLEKGQARLLGGLHIVFDDFADNVSF
jgi:hypothetical protein